MGTQVLWSEGQLVDPAGIPLPILPEGISFDDLYLEGSSADAIPLTVRAHPSGTVTQVWEDGTGADVAYVTAGGLIVAPAVGFAGPYLQASSESGTFLWFPGTYAMFQQRNPAEAALVIKGAAAQATHLTVWTNSADDQVARIDLLGGLATPYVQATQVTGAYAEFDGNAVGVIQRNPAATALHIRGAAAQATWLTEWLDSAFTRVAAVEQTGGIRTPYIQKLDAAGTYLDLQQLFMTVEQRNPNQPVFRIKGASGQLANHLDFVDNSDNILARVNAGNFYMNSVRHTDATGSFITFNSNEYVQINSASASMSPLTIQGYAAQTWNLLNFIDSAYATVAYVAANGDIGTGLITGLTAASTLNVGDTADSGAFAIRRNTIISESKDVTVGTTTGTKIGTASTQKLGFFGATPIVRPTGVAVSAAGIHAALVNLGLIAA